MPAKTNTERIEKLEERTYNLMARLDVHDVQIKGILEAQTKGADTVANHGKKVAVIEEKITVLGELKSCLEDVRNLPKNLAILSKDMADLGKWKEDLKKAREESARRLWAFGPNIVGALIAGAISLIGVGLSVGLTYWLRKL